jgi:hypothetical protein
MVLEPLSVLCEFSSILESQRLSNLLSFIDSFKKDLLSTEEVNQFRHCIVRFFFFNSRQIFEEEYHKTNFMH